VKIPLRSRGVAFFKLQLICSFLISRSYLSCRILGINQSEVNNQLKQVPFTLLLVRGHLFIGYTMGKVEGTTTAESTDYETTLKQKLDMIPRMEFVEDVDAFMELPVNAGNAQETLKRVDEFYQRVKLLESQNTSTKRKLKEQIEELRKGREMLEELKNQKSANKDTSANFRLADHVFVKAKIKPIETVGLWLGANIMLEYGIEEGEKLLREKHVKAEESLRMTNSLIDSIREQITTVEVNMARIYNWDVKRRQAEKERAGIATKS